ncbi:iron-sulfur cluster biosynthesis family protein [Paenibacillus oenotherae]|uniref:Iron-sulfur cluster biosynthesis family protein n=1 Tax=Paenibacillus oenotherae TaxID=1435645 RepID=A0ABS7D1Z7_9BACL|nr:iron-sulfur cluster biosynthesis family protein [Paenibacillus oenotherae]MBW7473965.1 iron-sulfur cluster biosynthesis family protein [Paenibacillus oenotherae]
MQFTFTDSAVEQLSGLLEDGNRSLRLKYDTEGCGCVVSGVPALELIGAPDADDKQADGTPYAVWYEPRFAVFFEPNLRIDYNKERHSFSLKSDNQIYTNNLRLVK